MITLNLRKKEFDLIKSGRKKTDYRDPSRFNKKKLLKIDENGLFTANYDIKEICFRNGYKRDSESMVVEVVSIIPVKFTQAYTNEEDNFSAVAGCCQIEIKLGQIKQGG